MKKERTVRIQDLLGLLNALCPPSLAEEWDNVGLQVGDPTAGLNRVLVCLDPSERALDVARECGAEALLSHHPLIFRPLKNLTPTDETGRIVFRAAREGVAVLCAHTNLDRAAPGLNDWLAERLRLVDTAPLVADAGGGLLKLVVFVPKGYEGTVAEAMFRAGAGRIGRYDHCSFTTEGTGTFRPGEGTDPFIGRWGATERVPEVRLETIISRKMQAKVLEKMLRAHPYEEAAYDLVPLANRRPDIGLGRIGRLPAPFSLGEFAAAVRSALGSESVRLVGDPQRTVCKVAVCGGSGASLVNETARQGADVLVTGDVKYHEAKNAESRGLALIDAGHFATERLMVRGLAEGLRAESERRGLKLEFIEMEGEEDPFKTV